MKNFVLKWNSFPNSATNDVVYVADTPLAPYFSAKIVAEFDKNKETGETETYFYAIQLYGFSKPFSTLHEAQEALQNLHDKNWKKWLEKWDLV